MVGRSAPGLWVIPNGLSATSYNTRNCQWRKVVQLQKGILQLYHELVSLVYVLVILNGLSATSSTETEQWRKIKCNQCDNTPNGLSATSYNGRNCMVEKSHASVTNAMQCDNTKGLFHHFSQKKLLLSSYHGFNAYDLEITKSWNNSCNCSLFTRVANLFIMIHLFLEPKLLKKRAIMRAMP